MIKVLVTGASGFIGRHMVEALSRRPNVSVLRFDIESTDADLDLHLAQADVVYHLAGVNRPPDPAAFQTGNADFTRTLCEKLGALRRAPLLVLSSSTHSVLDNPYGRSKKAAEEIVAEYALATGAAARIFRLTNVFGKWCRPNYNSVVATFCHNVANGLPITINEPTRQLDLVYIDDVVAALLAPLDEEQSGGCEFREVAHVFQVGLGDLADTLHSFRDMRTTLLLPDFGDRFVRSLYATYLSYLPGPEFAYGLAIKTDPRGSLAEFMKSRQFGQLFVSRTHPGITRGNHYHHTKVEKFFVVEGEGLVRFRHIEGTEVIEHRVRGEDYRVVDIPPGYTHSIENVGTGVLITLFWASEIFDPTAPETYGKVVLLD